MPLYFSDSVPPLDVVLSVLTNYWPWSELWLVGYRQIKLKVFRDNTAGILERLIRNYNVIKALLTYYRSSFKCWIVFVVGCKLIRVVGVPVCYWTWESYRWYIFMVDKCLQVVSTRNFNIACTTCFSNRQVSNPRAHCVIAHCWSQNEIPGEHFNVYGI